MSVKTSAFEMYKTSFLLLAVAAACIPSMSHAVVGEVYLSPEPTDEQRGVFLHGVSADLQDDYAELKFSPSFDMDGYSEIDITDASNASVAVIQRGLLSANSDNRAKVVQSGNRNGAHIEQNGGRNVAYVNQHGEGNTAIVNQLGVNNEAFIDQQGANNIALIGQANLKMHSGSRLSIKQTSDNNIALILGGTGANHGITQDGNDMAIIDASSAMQIYLNQTN